jgi:hypothetical protein
LRRSGYAQSDLGTDAATAERTVANDCTGVVSTHPDDRRDRQRTELRFFPKFGIELIIGHGDAELAVHVAH